MACSTFEELKDKSLPGKSNRLDLDTQMEEAFELPDTLQEAHSLINKYRYALGRICEEGYGSAVDIADEAL